MLYATIKNIKKYHLLESKLKMVTDFLDNNDLESIEPGSLKIDGDNFFVNVLRYETQDEDKRSWESHDKYLDVHVLLDGTEGLEVTNTSEMNRVEYNDVKDKATLTGDPNVKLTLKPGEMLVCYPDDGHKTGIQVTDTPSNLKKFVFKVKL
ncbi:MAG: YhcH/YjgK/YiaL family protein [Lentilactobacillus hilgardii]